MSVTLRALRLGALLVVLTVSIVVLLPRPALGCSCAHFDFEERLDKAPAAFVGKIVAAEPTEPQDSHLDHVYRFEVEEWIKGDLGPLVDVEAPNQTSSCGLGGGPVVAEFSPRLGIFLHESNGVLKTSLCGLMDPDLMIRALAGPTLSATGVPRVMLTKWGSPVLSVLDDQAHVVAQLDPRTGPEDPWNRYSHSICPEARLMVQADMHVLTIWDLETLKVHSRTALDRTAPGQLWCRDEDAGSVWMTTGAPGRVQVIDLFTGDQILSTNGYGGWIGGQHMLTQGSMQKSVTRVDLETGVALLLHEVPHDSLWSVSGAPNPVSGTTAVVERRVDDRAYPIGSTLFVYDEQGNVTFEMELSASVEGVDWRDVNTVVAVVPTDVFNTVYLIDAPTGRFSTVTNWPVSEATGRGVDIFGLSWEGELWHGDINTGFYSHVGSILEPGDTYVVLSFDGAAAVTVDPALARRTREFTVAPLTLDDLEGLGSRTGEDEEQIPSIPIVPPSLETETGSTLARVVFIGIAVAALASGMTMSLRRRSDEG